MKVQLIAYGIAKDILNGNVLELEVKNEASIAQLKKELVNKFPAFKDLTSLKMAVNEEYREDDFVVSERDKVVIIPPVSGG